MAHGYLKLRGLREKPLLCRAHSRKEPSHPIILTQTKPQH